MRERTRTWIVAVCIGALLGAVWFLRAHRAGPSTIAVSPGSARTVEGAPSDIAPGPASPAGAATKAATSTPQSGLELEVHVLSRAGAVPGARAKLFWTPERSVTEDTPWTLLSSATTDSLGVARLSFLPGTLLVTASAPGFGEARSVRWQGAASRNPRVTLILPTAVQLVGQLVSTSSGAPIAPAEVRLARLWRYHNQRSGPVEDTLQTEVDPEGRFSFSGLAPGRYWVEARAPGYARRGQIVPVPQTGPLTLRLVSSGFIEGFVRTAEGQPAGHAIVIIRSPAGTVRGEADAAGAYSLEVIPGRHFVVASAQGSAGQAPGPIEVRPGETVRDVDIVLGSGGAIFGRVLAQGRPVEGAELTVDDETGTQVATAQSDAAGRFRIEALLAGTYEVEASAPGFAPFERDHVVVSPPAATGLEIDLQGGAALRGSVRDRAGQPIPGAIVSVVNGAVETTVDGAGTYELDALPAGKLLVMARRSTAALGPARELTLEAGQTTEADFTLANPATLSGQVYWRSGRPAQRVVRIVAEPRAPPLHSGGTESTPDGHYSLQLAPGSYALSVRFDGTVQGFNSVNAVEVGLADGETRNLDLYLPMDDEADELHGLVLEPGGAPSIRPLIGIAIPGLGTRYFRAMEDGTFVMPLPEKLDQPMRIVARNGTREGEASATPDQLQPVIQLHPGAAVQGHVVRTDGRPITSVEVSAHETGGIWPAPFFEGTPTRFPGSHFRLALPAGQLRVRVQTDDGAVGESSLTLAPGETGSLDIPIAAPANPAPTPKRAPQRRRAIRPHRPPAS